MISRSKRVVAVLWSLVAVAVVSLWPSPAQAGHTGHRVRHIGSHRQGVKPRVKAASVDARSGAPAGSPRATGPTTSTTVPSR